MGIDGGLSDIFEVSAEGINKSVDNDRFKIKFSEEVSQLLKEDNQCKDIFQVIGHRAIFFILHEFVFGKENTDALKGLDKCSRTLCFNNEEKLKYLIEFLSKEDNIDKLSNKILENYKNHKEAYDKAGVSDMHKNTAGLLIAYFKEISKYKKIYGGDFDFSQILNQEDNNTIIALKSNSLINNFKRGFEIFVTRKNLEGFNVVDKDGNIEKSTKINDYFKYPTAKVAGRYINAETREPIEVSLENGDYDLINVYKKINLPNKQIGIECRLKNKKIQEKIKIVLDKDMNPIKVGDKYLSGECVFSSSYELSDKKIYYLDEKLQICKTNEGNIIKKICFYKGFCEKGKIYDSLLYAGEKSFFTFIIQTVNGKYEELNKIGDGYKIIDIQELGGGKDTFLLRVVKGAKEYLGTMDKQLNFKKSLWKTLFHKKK